MLCTALNADGSPCGMAEQFVVDGFCPAHKPGGKERLKAAGAKGGESTKQKLSFPGFPKDWEEDVVDISSALRMLAKVGKAHRLELVSDDACKVQSGNLREYVSGQRARITERLETELEAKLAALTDENDELRRELAARGAHLTSLKSA